VPPRVRLSAADARRILGMEVPRDEMARILTALEFTCEPDGGEALQVTAPVSRLDIGTGMVGVHDLLEEIARILGYDRIPVTEMADTLPPQRNNPAVELEERVRDLLAVAGLQEVISYRLTTTDRDALRLPGSGAEDAAFVRLSNPVSADRAVLRRTLIPGLLEAIVQNARNRDRLWFFELGPVFFPAPSQKLPVESRRLGIGMAGPMAPGSWREPEPPRIDFFALKGVVEALLAGLHIGEVGFEPVENPLVAPGRAARVVVRGAAIGLLGEVHPRIRTGLDLAVQPVCVAELDLERLFLLVPTSFGLRPIPRFPPVLEDIALVVDAAVSAGAVTAAIREAGGSLLSEVRLFDVYQGSQVASGQKSLAFSLAFQAPDRTLTDAEVEKEKTRIVTALGERVGARLRG
jgi:phenylalanyl-tRNA synthetase beta chain